MFITCLDLEGVLVPEIWIAFADKVGIPEFRRTTRDEPDYDRLMRYRLDLLDKYGFGLKEIADVISSIQPLIGAEEFLDRLREKTQVLILSDTFDQFGRPLMKKLNWPTLFCNSLLVSPEGRITGYKMRCPHSKLTTVRALQSCGFETIAAGDSFNDLEMIHGSTAGFLFRSTDEIKNENPDLKAFETYDDLLKAIFSVL
jgi:phosphoserine/homoserine phosphotransferase